jgi:uncharacterized Zn-binding protein involved in type VI secretion
MGKPCVTATAMLACSFGVAPSTLNVLPTRRVMVGGKPTATILDAVPGVSMAPFGMCTTLSNPTVAAATAAALGVLTPMPCMPVPTPWKPGAPTVLVGGTPALTVGSTCQCAFGGVITVTMPGQFQVLAP